MASEERDVELEDGECSDSDDDQTTFNNTPAVHSTSSKDFAPQSLDYRSRIPQIVINSDESNDSSDEDYPSAWKKPRSPGERFHMNQDKTDTPFINPLRSSNAVGLASSSVAQQRKKNNIWGSVLTEQVLAHEVRTFGVNNSVIHMDSRDVESYDFTKAREDERPDLEIDPDEFDDAKDDIFGEVVDLEKEVKRHENRKRKRTMKERLGHRTYDRHKKRTLGVTADDEISDVVSAITKGLNEPKIDLFTRIVEEIGKDLAIKLYYMTEDVEEAGGMMTNDGYRRRTPGGVYIQLLKNDSSIPTDTINAIFEDEYLEYKKKLREQRKIKKAARKRFRRQMARREMDIDRPETPTPAEDLEVLNALDSNNEFDAADLPERPATPEPKDDSSDGQDEDGDEDDEEVDISVAIARAKEAILRKQREMASRIGLEVKTDEESSTQASAEIGDGSDSGWKDNEMIDDGDSIASASKMSTQEIASSVDVLTVTTDVDIGEMEDV